MARGRSPSNMTVAQLKAEALMACKSRGHKMTSWVHYTTGGRWGERFVSSCKDCGMEVAVTPHPAPNGIEIGGEAVALNCPGEGKARWTPEKGWGVVTGRQAREAIDDTVSRLTRRRENPAPVARIGTVSEGTLKDDDLIDAFVSELEHLYRGHRMPADLKQLLKEADDLGAEDTSTIVDDLSRALDELAPSYASFGTLEGDGAHFGFWPNIEGLEEAARNGEVLKLDAGDDPPKGYRGEVMYVTDHGNVTFGYIDGRGRFKEIWSVV